MKIREALLDLLFPPKCVFCRRILPKEEKRQGYCGECAEQLIREPVQVDGAAWRKCAAVLDYSEPVRRAVARFKFEDHPEYARVFGPLLAQLISQELSGSYDILSWVPVSPKRLRSRGYDQAGLLAQEAAAALGVTAVPTLRKVRHNAAQSGMADADARRSNVQGVYEPCDPALAEGRRILLIDDIVTTGATLEEAASALLTAGAEAVVCAALAHPAKRTKN